MTYEVETTAQFRRGLAKLPLSVFAAVSELVGEIAENPQRLGKVLYAPYLGCHGARRGSYRLIYRIREDTVTLVRVDHRAGVYRA